MQFRSTNSKFTHFQGDVVSNVDDSSHGVKLSGGSTGGVVEPCGDEDNIALTVRAKGTGLTVIGSTGGQISLNSTRTTIGSGSTFNMSMIQRYFVHFTVPALAADAAAVSTVTVAGLTTNSMLIFQPRLELNSTVAGVIATARCSTANSLAITFVNTGSTLSGSTQSAYLLQIKG